MNSFNGKIRKYEVKANENIVPAVNSQLSKTDQVSTINLDHIILESKDKNIPSISRKIDSSIRQKYKSFEIHPNESNRQRLRKSLKNFRCVFHFALVESPVKKRTQIQACSISLMIVAIVIISFILVNFTATEFTHANIVSTIVVPTENNVIKSLNDNNESHKSESHFFKEENKSIYIKIFHNRTQKQTLDRFKPLDELRLNINKNIIPNIFSSLLKLYEDARTHAKLSNYSYEKGQNQSLKVSKVEVSDELKNFCSCQKNEVCMLDTEVNGKSVCRQAVDLKDPTGCGGLCALETEACQLVDKNTGVRTCRQISLTTCSTHEWRCRNGFCVTVEARCDGSIQCYDRSDEMYCDCDLTKQFRCGHGISCFSNNKKCNGIVDCWDGFDESDCVTKCEKDQFACTDGQCIPQEYFCDGRADCVDASDEPNGCGGACHAHEIACDNNRCILRSAICNDHDDCGDFSDERNCTKKI